MPALLTIAASLAVLTGIGAYLLHLERKRTQALHTAAERMGWSFAAEADLGVVPGMERLELFTRGRGQKIRNLSRGGRGDRQVTLFDYEYVTGSGRSRRAWRQTVVHVHSPRLRLPRFALRPEHVVHKIGGLFGYRDIDLPSDPEFSRRYLLRGQDEPAIRAVFGPGVLDFYDRNPRCCTEADGSGLFFWRTSRRVAPEDVPAIADLALALADRFEAESGSGTVPV